MSSVLKLTYNFGRSKKITSNDSRGALSQVFLIFIEFYFLKLISLNKSQKQIHLLYENFIKKIFYLKKFNLDEEAFFIEFKTKILNG